MDKGLNKPIKNKLFYPDTGDGSKPLLMEGTT